MKTKRNERLGQTRINKQGLNMQVVKYINRSNIIVRIMESGEEIRTTWFRFKRGQVRADLLNHPVAGECTFGQAKWVMSGLALLAVGSVFAILYTLVR